MPGRNDPISCQRVSTKTFTGHTSPDLHFAMLQRGFHFDAVQMPLSAFDTASASSFRQKVLPALQKQGTAVLAMKRMCGNGRPMRDGVVGNASELIRYTLSLPVTTAILGMDSLGFLRQNIRTAQAFKPLEAEEMRGLETRCLAAARQRRYERYKSRARRRARRSSGRSGTSSATPDGSGHGEKHVAAGVVNQGGRVIPHPP